MRRSLLCLSIAATIALSLPVVAAAEAQEDEQLQAMQWRHIGPFN